MRIHGMSEMDAISKHRHLMTLSTSLSRHLVLVISAAAPLWFCYTGVSTSITSPPCALTSSSGLLSSLHRKLPSSRCVTEGEHMRLTLPLHGLAGAELHTVGNNTGKLLFLELTLEGNTLKQGQDELHRSASKRCGSAFLQGLLSAMASSIGSLW
jgi:hypothetical protein